MTDKKSVKLDVEQMSYLLGIISIVFAFFQPLAGLILGVIGFRYSKRKETDISKKAKKYNTIGIVLGIVFLVLSIVASIFLTQQNFAQLFQ